MKKIITKLEPFSLNQTIYTYEDGNKIDVLENVKTTEVASKILELAKTENIHEVEFVGPKSFAKGIGDNVLARELSEYNRQEITIKYL